MEALSFIKLKEALLNKYQLDADEFKTRFLCAKFDMGERPTQFIYRIKGLWNRCLEAAKIKKTFEGLKPEIINEKYLFTVNPNLIVYLNENNSVSLEEISEKSHFYFKAHGENKTVVVNEHLNANATVFKPKQNEFDNSRNSQQYFFSKNTNDNRRQKF